MGALRNVVFHSLAELNAAILEQIRELNQAPFQKYDTTRQRMFEALDRPVLRPLPREAYEFATWVDKRKVPFTYHIQIERHHYSVPYQYLGRHVRARVGAQIVEIFDGET